MSNFFFFSLVFLSLFNLRAWSVERSIVSIYAVRCDDGKVVMDHNSDLYLVPASCTKIVTTGAALFILGKDHQFETVLEYDGSIEQGVLHGNIYIRGGGDPTLGSKRVLNERSWQKQLQVWVDAIEKLGISKIEGKIIGDDAKWEKASGVPSWSWEDLGNYYGAGASALSFHENMYSLVFKPGSVIGEKTEILRQEPPYDDIIFENEVTTGKEGSGDCACIYGSEYGSFCSVRGTIPLGVEEFAIKGAILDPAKYTANALLKALQERKVIVENRDFKSSRTHIHTTYSPPLEEIIYWTNQKSINLYAEHLLKKMGEVVFNEGSTACGKKAITQFWDAQGIRDLRIADGSGLSRKNLVTTKLLVDILLHMKRSPHFPVFLQSLPKKGENIRAKTGTMSLAKGCAGYLDNIVFAILINNEESSLGASNKIDHILQVLSDSANTE